jgi:hypothetical protein
VGRPETFPVEHLVAGTTLDTSQAAALKVALTQELALLQGPPGTGTHPAALIDQCFK